MSGNLVALLLCRHEWYILVHLYVPSPILLNFEKIMFIPQAKNTFKNVLPHEH
jgi:hypothetical protein